MTTLPQSSAFSYPQSLNSGDGIDNTLDTTSPFRSFGVILPAASKRQIRMHTETKLAILASIFAAGLLVFSVLLMTFRAKEEGQSKPVMAGRVPHLAEPSNKKQVTSLASVSRTVVRVP